MTLMDDFSLAALAGVAIVMGWVVVARARIDRENQLRLDMEAVLEGRRSPLEFVLALRSEKHREIWSDILARWAPLDRERAWPIDEAEKVRAIVSKVYPGSRSRR